MEGENERNCGNGGSGTGDVVLFWDDSAVWSGADGTSEAVASTVAVACVEDCSIYDGGVWLIVRRSEGARGGQCVSERLFTLLFCQAVINFLFTNNVTVSV